jgi:hypothetical protein
MKFSFYLRMTGAGILAITLSFSDARASMPPELYRSALKLAEQKVLRQKAAEGQAGALSASVISRLLGRYYEVGDNWDVAAWRIDRPWLMTNDKFMPHSEKLSRGGVFHYEVVEVKTGNNAGVQIKVTQSKAYGMEPIDPRVRFLTLQMDDRMTQSHKAYTFTSSHEAVAVSPEGIHSSITALELLPLDIPDVLTASRRTKDQLPPLPPSIKEFAHKIGFNPNLSLSTWFLQDDFFGRSQEILWQHGDPWPCYFKTSNGLAILLHKELRGAQ